MGTACGYKWEGDICVRGVFIGLSTLLLVLLLGLSSRSYAVSSTIWEDFAESISQADLNTNNYRKALYQWLTLPRYEAQRDVAYDYVSAYDNCAVLCNQTYNSEENIGERYYFGNITFYVWDNSSGLNYYTDVYNSKNDLGVNTSISWHWRTGSSSSDSLGSVHNATNQYIGRGYELRGRGVVSLDVPIYTTNSYEVVDTNWVSFYNYPITPPVQEFEFVTNSAINSCTITNQDGQTINNVPIFYQPIENVSNVYLGELYMADGSNKLIRLDYIQYAYYNSQSQSWVWRNLYNRQKSLPYRLISNTYISVTNNAEYSIFQISQKGNYILRDAIYMIGFDDADYTRAYGYYAILSSTTSLDSDGRVDPTTLPPDYDDKAKKFNDDIDDIDNTTGAIDDTITPVPDIDSMLNHFTSGDFAGNLGFQEQDHGYWNFLYGFTTQICDTLLSSGDVYYDYQMHGETPTRIWSSQFYVPDDNPLKFFVSLSLIFGTVFVFYYQFKNFIEYLETANVPKVLEQEDADMYFYKM